MKCKKLMYLLATVSLLIAAGADRATAAMTIDVRGNGVDIRNVGSSGLRHLYPLGDKESRFLDADDYHLFDVRSSPIIDKPYATVPIPVGYHKTDTRQDYELEAFSANETGKVRIAAPILANDVDGWARVPGAFNTTITNYYLNETVAADIKDI